MEQRYGVWSALNTARQCPPWRWPSPPTRVTSPPPLPTHTHHTLTCRTLSCSPMPPLASTSSSKAAASAPAMWCTCWTSAMVRSRRWRRQLLQGEQRRQQEREQGQEGKRRQQGGQRWSWARSASPSGVRGRGGGGVWCQRMDLAQGVGRSFLSLISWTRGLMPDETVSTSFQSFSLTSLPRTHSQWPRRDRRPGRSDATPDDQAGRVRRRHEQHGAGAADPAPGAAVQEQVGTGLCKSKQVWVWAWGYAKGTERRRA